MNPRIIRSTTLAISILLILISIVNVATANYGTSPENSTTEESQAILALNQQGQPITGEKRPVHINAFSGNTLSPEMAQIDEQDSVAQCPNGFVRTGFFGYGYAPVGETQWRLVGQWETTLRAPLNAGDQFVFNAWVRNKGSVQFAVLGFILKKNDEEIVRAESQEFSNQLSEAPANIEARKVGSANLTPFESGDKIVLRVECRINGDGTEMLYGSLAHDTGATLICDALNIVRVHGSKGGVCAEYHDSFFVSPAKMTFIAKVDDIIIDTLPEYDQTDDGLRVTHWSYSLKPGNHAVEVQMSYGGTDNTTMASFSGSINVPKDEKIEFLGIDLSVWLQGIGFIVFLIILAAIGVAIKRRREEKQLEKYLEESKAGGT